MKTEDGLELAAHIMGGLLTCDVCERTAIDECLAIQLHKDYDDRKLGLWLLAKKWVFTTQEHDHYGTSCSGKYPFVEGYNSLTNSMSWSYSLTCSSCSK